MNLLAIDTSTQQTIVTLWFNQYEYTKIEDQQRQQAALILPMIDTLLKEANASLSMLDGFVFGRGPGSFTGLRVGASIVKGFAYALDLPIYPVSTLQAIAAAGFQKEHNTPVLAILDARMNQLYWDYFDTNLQGIEEKVSDAKDIMVPSNTPITLLGVGFDSYWNDLSATLRTQIQHKEIQYPEPRMMIQLVEKGLIQPLSATEVTPVYIRNNVVTGASHG